jgi:MalT-like TPR region
VLAEALTLAYPQGYVRVFADEGAPMGALLGRLVAAQRSEQPAARGVPLDWTLLLGRRHLLRMLGGYVRHYNTSSGRTVAWPWPFPRQGSGSHRTPTLDLER